MLDAINVIRRNSVEKTKKENPIHIEEVLKRNKLAIKNIIEKKEPNFLFDGSSISEDFIILYYKDYLYSIPKLYFSRPFVH